MTTAARKTELRRRMGSERARLAPERHAACSLRAQERFCALERFAESRCVALYAPVRGEVRTDLVFEKARTDGKDIVFPKMLDREPGEMVFISVRDLAELAPGPFGISEPADGREPVAPDRIDLVAVPGVAFDASGFRLGYGGGYFDRLLARRDSRPRWAAGIAFDFQIVDDVPHGVHDQAVDQVVTESRVLTRRES